MNQALRGIAGAFAYYTVLPAGRAAASGPPDVTAFEWLPVIGAVTGAIAGLVGYAAFRWLHVPWSFVLAWALLVGLTGAIHVDGFLDSCDAVFATASPQRRLEILKDVHHGTFAVAGMAIVAALALAALAAIAPSRYPLVLAFSGAAARLAVLPQAWIFPYARADGMARTFASPPSALPIILNLALVEALAFLVAPWALALAPAAVLCAWVAARWASRRLAGGLTGDIYGALIVTTEVAILLAIGVISAH